MTMTCYVSTATTNYRNPPKPDDRNQIQLQPTTINYRFTPNIHRAYSPIFNQWGSLLPAPSLHLPIRSDFQVARPQLTLWGICFRSCYTPGQRILMTLVVVFTALCRVACSTGSVFLFGSRRTRWVLQGQRRRQRPRRLVQQAHRIAATAPDTLDGIDNVAIGALPLQNWGYRAHPDASRSESRTTTSDNEIFSAKKQIFMATAIGGLWIFRAPYMSYMCAVLPTLGMYTVSKSFILMRWFELQVGDDSRLVDLRIWDCFHLRISAKQWKRLLWL